MCTGAYRCCVYEGSNNEPMYSGAAYKYFDVDADVTHREKDACREACANDSRCTAAFFNDRKSVLKSNVCYLFNVPTDIAWKRDTTTGGCDAKYDRCFVKTGCKGAFH